MWGRTATELAAGIRAREFSAREVMEAHLARIAAVNPRVNAIVTLLDAGAGAARRPTRPTASEPRGVLHGLPIAVKDLEDTAGMRTTYGSPLFASHVPDADSLLVERLRAAGAIVIGKTNTPEFGAGSQTFNAVFGATRNPWDLTRTPGGSSGGAAAAVASGMLPFADGSDLGAQRPQPRGVLQPRRPAALAGRIPDAGPGDPWNPLPVLGPIARTVEDVALLLAALAGPDPRDPLSLGEPFAACAGGRRRAGCGSRWSRDLGGLPVDPAVTAVLEAQRATLEALGCVVEDAEPDFERRRRVLRGAARRRRSRARSRRSCTRSSRRWPRTSRFGLSPDAGADRAGARAARRAVRAHARVPRPLRRVRRAGHPGRRRSTSSASSRARSRASQMGSYLEWFRSCSRITVTSHPAVAGPGRASPPDGLPIGLQLVGRHRGEARAAAARARVHRGDRARRSGAAALMPWPTTPPTARAPRRVSPTPSRTRSGSRAARRARRRCTASPTPTCASSAAASPGCGRRCTPRRSTRRATSSCSRPRPPASAPAGATAGSAIASLTHGIDNGLARFADEMELLERLGLENFDGPARRPRTRYGIDCDFEPTGELLALTDAYQEPWLEEERESLERFGHEVTVLDGEAMRAEVASPTYLGGVWDHTGAGILDPGKLAARAARRGAARRRARVRALRRARPADAGRSSRR